MAGRTRNTIVALAIGAGCMVPRELSAAVYGQQTSLDVLIINEARVSLQVLMVARAEATRIYHAAGITLVWTDTPEARIECQFIVKITSRALKGKGVGSDAMGVALGTVETRGTMAYAFYDRIQSVTKTIGADPGLILGHVIAHEIGHLLLPYNAHAGSGLMRAGWDVDQAVRAMRGMLAFTAREAALMRGRSCNVDARKTATAAMTVLLLNNAGISRPVLQEAQAKAAQIYAAAGVTLVWAEPGPIARPSSASRLTMIILLNASVGRRRRSEHVMGTTPSSGGRLGRTAYAFYQRIETFAQRRGIGLGAILGCVMAHEMGHLLLAHGAHSSAGLMRARWDRFELELARTGRLTFTTREAAEIRSAAGATRLEIDREDSQ